MRDVKITEIYEEIIEVQRMVISSYMGRINTGVEQFTQQNAGDLYSSVAFSPNPRTERTLCCV